MHTAVFVEIWNFRSHATRSESFIDVNFVPENFGSMELSLPGAEVTWNLASLPNCTTVKMVLNHPRLLGNY